MAMEIEVGKLIGIYQTKKKKEKSPTPPPRYLMNLCPGKEMG